MPYEHDTATDHLDLFARLKDFLTDTTSGPGWDLLNATSTSMILRAHGLDDMQQIYFGFNVNASAGDDAYSIGQWMFRDYNSSLGHQAQPGVSGLVYLPIWNAATPYWFIANAQRVMIACKVSTVYPSSYAGKIFPSGTPGEYPQPYYLGAPVGTANTRWSTISESDRCFFDPGLAATISTPGALWRAVSNFYESAGEQMQFNQIGVWPYGAAITGAGDNVQRYREIRDNLDGSYSLWPCILLGQNPDFEIYGELDGCYAVSGFNQAAEDTFTISGTDYLVVQNMHRTGRMYYAALKLE